jgi:response regulator RpfG family c-di-GMP phosphodiesterase
MIENLARPPIARERGLTISDTQGQSAQIILRELLCSSLVLTEDWERLPARTRDELANSSDTKMILSSLVEHSLLTAYQADRVEAGTIYGLILGNYRVLDRLGAGGMGVVFKGEHLRMRRLVAIKVLTKSPGLNPGLLERFLSEMRAVAQLQHPNIVTAIDDGETLGLNADAPPLHYFVMEYVPGQDLEELVVAQGPHASDKACCLIYQVASALAEAHKHNLVHRDIKPSNIRVTPDGQAKLLDFGLVRQSHNRMTEPGTVLGTLDYLAPEQASDASSVDIRADIYGLGGTLFWCLTGETPFAAEGNFRENLIRRLTQSPPSLRARKPGSSAELDAVVARMMACNPDERYPTPQAAMNALLRFLKPESQEQLLFPHNGSTPGLASSVVADRASGLRRVLVVDDSPTIRQFCAFALQEEGIPCDEVANGYEALAALGTRSYDLVLSDWQMPGMTGLELCRKIRSNPPAPNLKVILFSAEVKDDDVAQVLASGVDDYLTKQFSPVQLVARVKASLHLKESQDRTDLLNRHLLACNQQLEQSLTARNVDLVQIRNALVLGLADLVAYRDVETISHVMRLPTYCRCLAEEAANFPAFAGQIDANYIQMLECCAPLHDIGKAGLPDHILGKSGNWDAEERLMMQSHTILGAETLQRVAQRHGSAVAFLQMAIDIARSHHERYDGKGYPDRLAGNVIPLAARILAIGDVYDGLRCRRTYKPALPHDAALQLMLEDSSGQFDPVLLHAFQRCAPQFEQIFRDMPG